MKTKTIFTCGHSNKTTETIIGKLKENNIKVLVDVRSIPFSRWIPQYNKMTIEKALTKEGIQYLYRGRNLGGLEINTEYEETIDELARYAKSGLNVCVMCSEGDYRKCHRYTVLTPSFWERGLLVTHIEYEHTPKLVAPKRATN